MAKNAIIDTSIVIKEDRLRPNLNHQIQMWSKTNKIHNQSRNPQSEQKKYTGPYYAYPPHFPGPFWHPSYNNPQNMENQNGQSYHVGNNIEGSEDTEYVNFGGRVLTREDFENIGYENCGPEMFEKMHFCDSVPDFQKY